jgi:2-C-methyl-D-erythritol 4-phosphate cytidylyltransferase
MNRTGVWAIVVAAGSGNRFGGAKQYEALGDRRVLDWSLASAGQACEATVLVVAPDRVDSSAREPCAAVVAGGTTRAASVRAGLAAVPDDAEVVVVHDAARPLATPAVFAAVIDAVRAGADGAVPAVPVIDSIRRLDGGAVDRTQFVAVQTPQAFRADVLRAAHAGERDASDDATLVEADGGKVVLVAGDPVNFKLTSPHDLVVARALIAAECGA